MKKETILNIFLSYLLFGFISCSRKCPIGMPPPQFLQLSVKHNGQRLSKDMLQQTKLTYMQGKTEVEVMDAEVRTYQDTIPVLGSGSIPENLSSDQNIKQYYIKYADNTRDTLMIDYKETKERCNSYTFLAQPITCNGKPVDIDTAVKVFRLYVIEKK